MEFDVGRGLASAAIGGLDRYGAVLKEDRETKAEQTKLDIAQEREQSMLLWKNEQAAIAGEAQKDRDFERSQSPEVLGAEKQQQERARQSGVDDAAAMAEGALDFEGKQSTVEAKGKLAAGARVEKEKDARAKQALKDEFADKAKAKTDALHEEALKKYGKNYTKEELIAVQMKQAGLPAPPKADSGVTQLTQDQFLTQYSKEYERVTESKDMTNPGVVKEVAKELEAWSAQNKPRPAKRQTVAQKEALAAKTTEVNSMVSSDEAMGKLAKEVMQGDRNANNAAGLLTSDNRKRLNTWLDMLQKETPAPGSTNLAPGVTPSTPQLKAGGAASESKEKPSWLKRAFTPGWKGESQGSQG